MEETESQQQVLYEGWMTKSPPLERTGHTLFKARWRRRWFVLQQGRGSSTRHYLLNYYSDETKKRLKGTISLDECEQVDIGLTAENGRYKYDFMFDIKTPRRIYFLAVDSHEEMTKWVRMVCNACGLRSTKEEVGDDEDGDQVRQDDGDRLGNPGEHLPADEVARLRAPEDNQAANGVGRRPGLSISSPYIHISTCYSGTRPAGASSAAPPSSSPNDVVASLDGGDEMGDDSVFESPQHRPPKAVPDRLPEKGLLNDSVTVSNLDERHPLQVGLVVLPPARPPKPAHLSASSGASSGVETQWRRSNDTPGAPPAAAAPSEYANSLEMQELCLREQNNNFGGGGSGSVAAIVPHKAKHPQNRETVAVQALPPPAPAAARDLKPGRRPAAKQEPSSGSAGGDPAPLHYRFRSQTMRSGGGGGESSCLQNFATLRPSKGPALKPLGPSSKFHSTAAGLSSEHNAMPPSWTNRAPSSDDESNNSGSESRRNSCNDEQIYYYMPSVNTVSAIGGTHPRHLMIPAESFEHPSISYIDLDLPPENADGGVVGAGPGQGVVSCHPKGPLPLKINGTQSTTIYRTVDFVKTNAFNRTKQKIESERETN